MLKLKYIFWGEMEELNITALCYLWGLLEVVFVAFTRPIHQVSPFRALHLI